MQILFKLAMVILPFPTIFFFLFSKKPKWAKSIALQWTMYTFLFCIITAQSEEFFTIYTNYFFISVLGFLFSNFIYFLLKIVVIHYVDENNQYLKKLKGEVNSADKSKKIKKQTENEQVLDACLAKLTERQEKVLYKFALQVLEKDKIANEELKKIKIWLTRYSESKQDYRTKAIYEKVNQIIDVGVFDADDSLELFALLSDFCDQIEAQQYQGAIPFIKGTIAVGAVVKKAPSDNLDVVSRNKSNLNKRKITLSNLIEGNEYLLSYKDATGKTTQRKIIFNQLGKTKQEDIYINAYCLLRKSYRTFRADRIVSLIETTSNIVIA